MLSHTLSYKKLYGLVFSALISRAAPLFNSIEMSLELTLCAVMRILKHIIRMNVILSFSNRPRLMYLYACNVRYLMMLSTLLGGYADFSDQSMDWLKSIKNYSSEELYIQLTRATSRTVK